MISAAREGVELKIWMVNHFAYGPDQSAGARHYTLARELQSAGHEVLVVTTSFYHKGRVESRLEPGEYYRRESLYSVPFQWIRTPSYYNSGLMRLVNMLAFSWRVYRGAWRQRGENPDVILGSSPSLTAAFAAYRLARVIGVPFVFEIRDIWPDALNDMGSLSKLNPVFWLFRWIERDLYKRSDYVITLLPNSFDHIRNRGGRNQRIAWIPNGVDLEERTPLPEKSGGHPFVFMYFGAHGPYNGLDVVVDAAALLKQRGWDKTRLRFVLLGEGPSKARIIKLANDADVSDLVEFRPAVSRQRLWHHIEDADAFMLVVRPMRAWEKGISPNKLWDYFAAARPVLFSTVGGHALAEESNAGVAVEPGDPGALADGVEHLVGLGSDKVNEMGRNARAYVENTANIPLLADRMMYVFRGVV